MKVAASPRSRAQVAAVLAFVISHTTFLAAQDDETGRCPIKNHSRPFLWKRGERSEAGLASPHMKIPLHAANLRPFGAPPSKGRREKSGVRCLVTRAPGSRGGFAASIYEAMPD